MRLVAWSLAIALSCGGTTSSSQPWCNGKPTATFAQLKGQPHPRAPALDATFLYWIDDAGLVRFSRDGATPLETVVSGAVSFVLDGDDILYLAPENGVTTLWSVPKAGGAPTRIAPDVPWSVLIATDASSIFGGDQQHVASIPKTGGAEKTIAGGSAIGMIADDSYFYFLDDFVPGVDRRGISRLAKAGGPRESFVSFSKDFAVSFAVDTTSIYWSGCSGIPCDPFHVPDASIIAAMNKSTRQRRVLASEQVTLGDIAIGGDGVFVARGGTPIRNNMNGYSLERVGLDGGSVSVPEDSYLSNNGLFDVVADEHGAYAVDIQEGLTALVGMTCP